MKQRRMCHFSPAREKQRPRFVPQVPPPSISSRLCSAHPAGNRPQLLCENSRVLKGDEVIALLARLRLCVAPSEGRFHSVGHLDLFRVRRGLYFVVVVVVPPLVRRGLWVALWRVLPLLLA